jgi:phosphate transport system permease protein
VTLTTPEVTTELVHAALVGRRADVRGAVFRLLLQAALAFSILVLGVLLYQMVSDGASVLTGRLGDFLTRPTSAIPERAGIAQALKGSFWLGAIVIVLAFPVGISAGLYLEEFEHKGRLASFIDLNIRNLAGVPSVVYGILGLSVFAKWSDGLTGGNTILAGGLTLAVLVLPIVIITTMEAVRAVPDSIREGGFGVGATRWEIIRHFVLPYAAPGIITGTILALARALGEAAPLLLVGAIAKPGGNPGWFDLSQLRESFTAMPVLITDWAGEAKAGFRPATAAAIVVMLVVVLLANTTAILLRNRYEKKRHG